MNNSTHSFHDCMVFAKTFCQILNRLSFLRLQDSVDDNFIQFFEQYFNQGRTLLNWLDITNRDPMSFTKLYPYFREIKDTPTYVYHDIALTSPFYFYARKCNDDPSYIPIGDKTNSTSYMTTQEDIDLIKPE